VTNCGLEGRKIRVSFPAGKSDLFFLYSIQNGSRPTPSPVQRITGGSFSGS
jgi:hypothetical protein